MKFLKYIQLHYIRLRTQRWLKTCRDPLKLTVLQAAAFGIDLAFTAYSPILRPQKIGKENAESTGNK